MKTIIKDIEKACQYLDDLIKSDEIYSFENIGKDWRAIIFYQLAKKEERYRKNIAINWIKYRKSMYIRFNLKKDPIVYLQYIWENKE
jgi:hypothetical protein